LPALPAPTALKIVAPDLKAFADVTLHRLLNLPMVSNVKSNLLLQTLKSTTELPVRWSL
jgi:hypothetical protein